MKEEKIEKNYVKRLKMITSNIGYIALLVAIIVAVIMLIVNWSSTVAALGKMFRVFMPFILGFLFAFLIQPLIRGLMKLFDHIKVGKGMKIKKAISMLLSYVIVLGVLAVIVIFVAPQIAQSVRELGKTVQRGYDYIQGSRFIKGGHGINTPLVRSMAVRLIHAPVISLTAHQHFTDTTSAFRAYSRRYLTDERVQPLRDIFVTYELLAYLSVRATQIGMKACEVPVTRAYPKKGKTPTKISFFKGNSELMKILFRNARGLYNP